MATKSETAPRTGKNAPKPRPKSRTIEAINNLARKHSKRAIEITAACMEDELAPWNVRLAAASNILDRGIGKPVSKTELDGKVDHNHEVNFGAMHLTAVKAISAMPQDVVRQVGVLLKEHESDAMNGAPLESAKLIEAKAECRDDAKRAYAASMPDE